MTAELILQHVAAAFVGSAIGSSIGLAIIAFSDNFRWSRRKLKPTNLPPIRTFGPIIIHEGAEVLWGFTNAIDNSDGRIEGGPPMIDVEAIDNTCIDPELWEDGLRMRPRYPRAARHA